MRTTQSRRLLGVGVIAVVLGFSSVRCGDTDTTVGGEVPENDGTTPPEEADSDTGNRPPPQSSPTPPPAPVDAGPCIDVVDVVFALDVSGSMEFVLDKLDAEIESVVAAATKLAPDPHFGLIAFSDNYVLDATGPLSDGKVHTGTATLRKAFQEYKRTYTAMNRNPADGPNGPTMQNPVCEENSLDALYAAAKEFPWRPNATRVIIVATDDTFLERPDNYGDRDGDGRTDKTSFPSEGNYPAKWTLAETVEAVKAQGARVFAFSRLKPPGGFDLLLRCGTPRRLPWESVSDGWSTPYKGAEPIPVQTKGKNFDLDLVRANKLSMSETINNVVVESYCNPILQ